ncbi:hypothetical protein [Pseudonocardia acidicola]|uniref:Transcriptional regulator with AbiEi antitoxin domain of type IV toxin-antitoxin system n=1 Tax=Pseudonocardia acidicola TaxID=2724939 RepID=A0ABX1SN80_9PSEU|nr:hypothetical protein [Pseudonocardia acidicola]NMI02043.1 hypothetical protein [Pseudonocardia acidicola]
MIDSTDFLVQLCALAEGQWGQVALAQIADQVPAPVIEHWHRVGIVEPVIDGVVRVRAGARHPFPRLYAAWLRLDPEPAWLRTPPTLAVVSHRSAARLYRVLDHTTSVPEFTAAAPALQPTDAVVHRAPLREQDRRVIAGLPVTSPARTLVDLSTGAGLDLAELGRIAQALIAQSWTTADQLAGDLTDVFTHLGAPRDGDKWLHAALDASTAA